MITISSWDAQVAFYTGEHISSTSALVFLVIPFYSLITGFIGGLAGWAINRDSTKKGKPKDESDTDFDSHIDSDGMSAYY